MKVIKIGAGVILAILALLVVLAPLGPLPGIFIGGTLTEVPAQWQDTSAVHEIRLRVPGTVARVVTIWVIEVDNELYVIGAEDSVWVSMIGQGSPVEMRLGDDLYSLRAIPMSEGWQPIYEAYLDKYRPDYPDIVSDFPEVEDAEGGGAIFHLARNS